MDFYLTTSASTFSCFQITGLLLKRTLTVHYCKLHFKILSYIQRKRSLTPLFPYGCDITCFFFKSQIFKLRQCYFFLLSCQPTQSTSNRNWCVKKVSGHNLRTGV